VNKTASFFSKNRVARRVKTNEDNRGRARKDREREREHEVEFEIHSASGVSSGDNSPNDRDGVRKVKRVGEEEKWMGTLFPGLGKTQTLISDILIANGAKRMDRQDAQPPRNLRPPLSVPGGLPPSPHPTHPNLPPTNAVGLQHTPELSYDNDRSAEDEAQSIAPATPRASAFSHADASPRSSEDREDPYAHGLARRHQGHEGNQAYNYSDEEEPRYSTDDPSSAEFTSRSSNETDHPHASSSGHIPAIQREIPIIAPTPTRDTIHNIVSQYQRGSVVSYDSQYDDSINPDSSPSKTVNTGASIDTEEERGGGDQFEELKSPLSPPVPTFDLTPGREPSPMRYRHGEPLQFGKLICAALPGKADN